MEKEDPEELQFVIEYMDKERGGCDPSNFTDRGRSTIIWINAHAKREVIMGTIHHERVLQMD